jgi:hypothetical protein
MPTGSVSPARCPSASSPMAASRCPASIRSRGVFDASSAACAAQRARTAPRRHPGVAKARHIAMRYALRMVSGLLQRTPLLTPPASYRESARLSMLCRRAPRVGNSHRLVWGVPARWQGVIAENPEEFCCTEEKEVVKCCCPAIIQGKRRDGGRTLSFGAAFALGEGRTDNGSGFRSWDFKKEKSVE